MRIRVQGNQPLNGTYTPSGNPNAAKALLAAAMLSAQPVTLNRVPRNSSTQGMFATAQALGCQLTWQTPHSVMLHTEQINSRTLNKSLLSDAVSTLLFLAPLLVRREHTRLEVNYPLSRIRTHLDVLRELGIDVSTSHGAVNCRATRWTKRSIILESPSVTATALALMLAATLGERTLIYNAACEPHIVDLCRMLSNMGAQIEGVASNRLTVYGTPELQGTHYNLSYDHIEIASIAALVALSGGRAQILTDNDGSIPDLRAITRAYRHFGMNIDADADAVLIPKHTQLSVANREEDIDASIETAPYPGFPSDLVTVATVIATQAHGTSLIHEKLFRDRMLFVDTLKDMGANIILADPHRAIVVGGTPLRGTYIPTPDARFGLGLLTAALIAEGESVIDNAQAFDYTFDGILPKLRELGAHITHESQS